MYLGLPVTLDIPVPFLTITVIYDYKILYRICLNYSILIKRNFPEEKNVDVRMLQDNDSIIVNFLGIYSKKTNPNELFGINMDTAH